MRRSRLPRPADEAGFGLIEAIVAAAVLAVLALGVLAGIDGAASSAGREKARAVAASLAEQDQERMRAMRAVDLPEYRRTLADRTSAGSTYTVVSEADWVSDATAAAGLLHEQRRQGRLPAAAHHRHVARTVGTAHRRRAHRLAARAADRLGGRRQRHARRRRSRTATAAGVAGLP